MGTTYHQTPLYLYLVAHLRRRHSREHPGHHLLYRLRRQRLERERLVLLSRGLPPRRRLQRVIETYPRRTSGSSKCLP